MPRLTEYELQKRISYHENKANYYYDKLEQLEEDFNKIGFKLNEKRSQFNRFKASSKK